MPDRIYNEDCITGIAKLPDDYIDCCVTSPPYYGLRDYGVDGQIGLEDTPEQYGEMLRQVFAEVRRVLKPDGTLWLNLGDSYNGSQKGSGGTGEMSAKQNSNKGANYAAGGKALKMNIDGLKPKDLIGIPWRVAFALQADGWWLRQDIIWSKPNPMPESVTDRCTKAHEYIFLLSKNSSYYYDHEAVKETANDKYASRYNSAFNVGEKESAGCGRPGNASNTGGMKEYTGFRNKRSVWTVATHSYSEAHFATFPEKLIEPCILAGCPKDGIVLDPFMGAGTTALVATRHGRHYIGYELNAEYVKLAEKRISAVQLKFA